MAVCHPLLVVPSQYMFLLIPSLLLAQSPETGSTGLGNVDAGGDFHT